METIYTKAELAPRELGIIFQEHCRPQWSLENLFCIKPAKSRKVPLPELSANPCLALLSRW